MKKVVSSKTAGFNLYANSYKCEDVVSVEMPEMELETEEVAGAGILGKIEMPAMTDVGSMEITVKLKATSSNRTYKELAKGGMLETRWATNVIDPTTGVPDLVSNKAYAKVVLKKIADGTIENGSPQEAEMTFECLTWKRVVNGETVVEIDKLNNINKIAGQDFSSKLSSML